jgi:hypothetical protein
MPSLNSDNPVDYVASVFGAGGASRDQLLRTAFTNNAPHSVIQALFELRRAYFFSVAEVREELDGRSGSDAG